MSNLTGHNGEGLQKLKHFASAKWAAMHIQKLMNAENAEIVGRLEHNGQYYSTGEYNPLIRGTLSNYKTQT